MTRKIMLVGLVAAVLLLSIVTGSQMLLSKTTADEAAVTAANNLYESGYYSEAVQIYQQMVDQGVRESVVFYNLGNAYFQQQDYARAILNYQKASLLNPRDEAIKINLELAQKKVNVELPAMAPGPVAIAADLTGKWFTLDETAILALALWFVTGLFFFAWRIFSNQRSSSLWKFASIGSSLVLLLVMLSLAGRLLTSQSNSEGIVVAPIVALQSEPGDHFETGVEIRAGSVVDLLEARGEWIHLSGPGDSYSGWVPASAVETVAGFPIEMQA